MLSLSSTQKLWIGLGAAIIIGIVVFLVIWFSGDDENSSGNPPSNNTPDTDSPEAVKNEWYATPAFIANAKNNDPPPAGIDKVLADNTFVPPKFNGGNVDITTYNEGGTVSWKNYANDANIGKDYLENPRLKYKYTNYVCPKECTKVMVHEYKPMWKCA